MANPSPQSKDTVRQEKPKLKQKQTQHSVKWHSKCRINLARKLFNGSKFSDYGPGFTSSSRNLLLSRPRNWTLLHQFSRFYESQEVREEDQNRVFRRKTVFRISVFWPPGSGSTSQRNGSGSVSGSFYNHAKMMRKILIPTFLWLFLAFYLWKICKCTFKK